MVISLAPKSMRRNIFTNCKNFISDDEAAGFSLSDVMDHLNVENSPHKIFDLDEKVVDSPYIIRSLFKPPKVQHLLFRFQMNIKKM